jgi:hypothetical protein
MPKASNSESRHSPRHTRVPNPYKHRTPALPPVAPQQPASEAGTDSDVHTVAVNGQSPGWKHPDELEFIEPPNLGKEQLIGFLCANGFSIPGRGNGVPPACVKILGRNGRATSLPWRYRIPLMFVAKFLWESLRMVMVSSAQTPDLLEDTKFDIFHIGRLLTALLKEAKRTKKQAGSIDRTWRCPTFDRALTRYYRRWLVSHEEYIRDFWLEFGEEEFEADVLKHSP